MSDDGRQSDSDEFRLQEESDARTPEELETIKSSRVRLPLPDQDRAAIEEQIRKNRTSKFSILELILATTSICVLLSLANWIELKYLALGFGLATVLLLFGLFKHLIADRYRIALIVLLLCAYLIVAVAAIVSKP